MNELWCVVECNADGEIFKPDFFKSKEEAIELIKRDANECYEQIMDYSDGDIRIADDGLSASVWTDEYSWVWKAFEVSRDIV